MMFKLSKPCFKFSNLIFTTIDTLLIFVSVWFSLELLSVQSRTILDSSYNIIFIIFPFIIVIQICFYYSGLYDERLYSPSRIFLKIIIALATASAILAAAYYFIPFIQLEKNIFFSSISTSFVLLTSARVMHLFLSGRRHQKQRIIIIGTGQKAKEVADLIRTKNGKNYELLGFIDTDDRLEASVSSLSLVQSRNSKKLSKAKDNVEKWEMSVEGSGTYHSPMQRSTNSESEMTLQRKIDGAWIKRRILDKN